MPEKKHPLYQFKYCPKCGSNHFVDNNFKSKCCEDCGFIYYFNPSSATIGVIFNEKNEILVATRAHEPAKGTLDLPGGFVDMNETAEEAVIREIKEETGLDVSAAQYLFSIPNLYMYSGFEVETTDLFFLCKVDSNARFAANDDVAELKFLPLSDLNPSLFGLRSVKQGIAKIQMMNL
ncbi:mutator protein MutT [Dysgonomonas alginatilytica]|uniref:Mutator protein MutT n=1 Tax=Dysgonomonas alginatilytica TaxID=1605892 RepID=A0A2V3PV48_9BACT|nr:NUDIX domain-containing protein [Dysgonomonas alginatilytica]PXV67564.1 mutator protein MutT [Dysgonomonas alginatilytica]